MKEDCTKLPAWLSIEKKKQEELIELFNTCKKNRSNDPEEWIEPFFAEVHKVLGHEARPGYAKWTIDKLVSAISYADGELFEKIHGYTTRFSIITMAVENISWQRENTNQTLLER